MHAMPVSAGVREREGKARESLPPSSLAAALAAMTALRGRPLQAGRMGRHVWQWSATNTSLRPDAAAVPACGPFPTLTLRARAWP